MSQACDRRERQAMTARFGDQPIDWRAAVRTHADTAGVDLPQATVDEIALHLDDLYSEAIAQGASPADARARSIAALEESAWAQLHRHAARDPRRFYARTADDAARISQTRSFSVPSAIRTAFRQFRQHPTFALVTILVLGLGTGAAATVFTVVDAVVLRPLPFDAPDRLVTFWDTNTEKGLAHDPISPVNFMDYRSLPVFKDAAAWWRPGVNLVDPGLDPVRVNTIEVAGNLFQVLGVRPQVGAGFPIDGPLFVQNELIAVISDRLWRTRYSADPSIIGRQLSLNDTPYTVVGVMPPKFHYPDDVDVWQRLRWDMTQHSRSAHFMEAVGRMSDGTTFEEAQSAVETLAARLQADFPQHNKGWATRLIPLLDEQLGYYRPALMVLFGAVGLLLVIGCLNVASLLLTRALSREREIAVRVAMGAAPRQLVTQLLAESLVLSLAGAVVGIIATAAALPIILNLTPVDIPRLDEASVDVRALGLCLGVVAVTTLFFGLLPALLLLRGQVTADLKSGERGSSRGARRVYSVLVAGEVALACALLVSSALLVRTVSRMTETPTGVNADQVVTTTVQLANSSYGPWRIVGETHARIMEEIRLQPGVQQVGGANFLPLEVGWRNPFGIEGEPPPARPEDAPQAQLHSVSEGYFEALGAGMASGRGFTPFDTPVAPGVVIVNESFVARFLPGRDAVGRVVTTTATGVGPLGLNLKRARPAPPPGQRLPPLPPTPFEIVGVVKDVRNVPLGQTIEPAIYFSTRQFPFRELFLAVRATDPATALAAIRTGLKNAAPNVPMAPAQTWGQRFAKRTAEPRLLMTILVFFGGLAGLLAALGVYGLFSWSVALRTRELAIRLTLGARPLSVGNLVIRQSAILVIAGLVLGLVVVRLAESALSRVLYEVSPSDIGSTAIASGVLLAAALIACVPPALRAMRVDPVVGLRAE
jgi:putative ABC transport system permease protein